MCLSVVPNCQLQNLFFKPKEEKRAQLPLETTSDNILFLHVELWYHHDCLNLAKNSSHHMTTSSLFQEQPGCLWGVQQIQVIPLSLERGKSCPYILTEWEDWKTVELGHRVVSHSVHLHQYADNGQINVTVSNIVAAVHNFAACILSSSGRWTSLTLQSCQRSTKSLSLSAHVTARCRYRYSQRQ